DLQGPVVAIAAGDGRVLAGAEVGHVRDDGPGERLGIVAGCVAAVVLTGAAGDVRVGDGEPELPAALPALVVVEGVVGGEGNGGVLHVHRPAEPLDAVVVAGEDLDVLDGGAAADAAEREALDLVALDAGDRVAAVADRDVAEDAGVVV